MYLSMMSNFSFLKNINNDLFKMISEAERLYCDGYFEQCIIQTRRFAENVCRNLLKNHAGDELTFDECITDLQNSFNDTVRHKELINDLYFLKAQGNLHVHSTKVKQDAYTALDCLKRAFEVAINYALDNDAPQNIKKSEFSEKFLTACKDNKIKETPKDKQIYERRKKQAEKYSYPNSIKNKKTALRMNFIGISVFAASIILYIYILFF